MPENIIQKIKAAEREAESLIHEARKEAQGEVIEAARSLETSTHDFIAKSHERLKRFREERIAFYKAEAENIQSEGKKARLSFEEKVERKFGSINEKVRKLIREELCL